MTDSTTAITAPTEAQAAEAVALAERIAATLSDDEVARAKHRAQELAGIDPAT
ncbi:hypothetical protein JDV09_12125 [Mycobacterium sp. Y57]|uniref:hypothetical protein n=1 Tax=Mycolicibacterium xanthum TaxID=2796469 RepID=UPI001C84839D|nr:hypothetical protein [Mycolicibacterium xanthum]MBX7432847.1 hypothetical protein [Mycolicibacterium xanthum]